jgi:hypothetical protein
VCVVCPAKESMFMRFLNVEGQYLYLHFDCSARYHIPVAKSAWLRHILKEPV